MRSRLEQHPLLTSLFVTLSLVIATLLKETSRFENNDDVGLMLMVSGRALSPVPTGWIYWIHPLLSHALAWLYGVSGNIPWYGLMHLGSLFLAFWMILYALLLKEFSWRQLSLFLLCLVSLGLPFILSLQFTKTSFLVGLSGVLLLATTLHQHLSCRTVRFRLLLRLVGATLLLILSLLIRREGLYLVCVLSLPLFGLLAWSAWKSQVLLFFLAVLTSLSLLLFVLAYVHRQAYTQSPEWSRFERVLHLKSAFIDYSRIPYNAESERYFREVGWSENDYRCMQRWLYIDPVIYSPEKLQSIVAHFPVTDQSFDEVQRALLSLFAYLQADGILWVALPLWLSILFLSEHSHLRMVQLASFLVAFLTMSLLVIFFKLPDRIYLPIVTSICWFALWLSGGQGVLGVSPTQTVLRNACGFLFAGITILFLLLRTDTPLAKAATLSRITLQDNISLRQALVRLSPHTSQTFVVWGGAFPYEAIRPLERHDYLQNFRIISLGAMNQSPIQQRMLNTQRIHDLPRALFERDDVFLSLFPERVEDGVLVKYLAEHYGVTVTLTPAFQETPLRFWKVTLLDTR